MEDQPQNVLPPDNRATLPRRNLIILVIIGVTVLAVGAGWFWYKETRVEPTTNNQLVPTENKEGYVYRPASYTHIDVPSDKKEISSWAKIDNYFYFLIYENDRRLKDIRIRIYRTPASKMGLKQDFELVTDLDEVLLPKTESFHPSSMLADSLSKTIFLIGVERGPTNIPPLTIFSAKLDHLRNSEGWRRNNPPPFKSDRTNVTLFGYGGHLYTFQPIYKGPGQLNPILYAKVDSQGVLGEWRQTQTAISSIERFFVLHDSLYIFEDSHESIYGGDTSRSFSGRLSTNLRHIPFQKGGDLFQFNPAVTITLDSSVDNRILNSRRVIGTLPTYEIHPFGNKIFFIFYNPTLKGNHLIVYASNEIMDNQQVTLKPLIEAPVAGPKNVIHMGATLSDEKNIYYLDYFREFGPSGEETDFTDKKGIYTIPILE